MKNGSTVEIVGGPFAGEVGVVEGVNDAGDRLAGPGFDLTISESQAQSVAVKIYGGALGVFVNKSELRVIES